MNDQECRACGADVQAFADGVVLQRIPVLYGRCTTCGLVQAENPTWLAEAYSSPIAALDIGLLDRCNILSHITATTIKSERISRGQFLDWAGGYGTLTRLMRDRGFDFRHMEPHSENLFAQGHELTDLTGARFDLITGYEVLEHLAAPVEELASVAAATDRLLMTTQILPDPPPRPGDWWYYAPESGQHITFYTARALTRLAERLGYDGAIVGQFVHYFYRGKPPNRATQFLLARPALAVGTGLLSSVTDRRRSLQQQDYRYSQAQIR